MPEVDFEVQASKTRGVIIETVCPEYRPYEVLIFPKAGNKHGIHGGELQHLPDGRSICSIILYRGDADLGAVFKKYKIIERFGWSPAITVMPPGGGIIDVITNVKKFLWQGIFIVIQILRLVSIRPKKWLALLLEKKHIRPAHVQSAMTLA